MSETLVRNQDVNNILRDIIAEYPDWQPGAVARVAFIRLAPAERDDALLLLLENQVSKVYALDRKPVRRFRSIRHDPHYPQWEERPPSNSIAAVRDHVPPIDPKTISSHAPIAHRVWAKTQLEGITQKEARELIAEEDEANRLRLEELMKENIAEMAALQRKLDIADALNRRICVRGTYKMLFDCTLEEVEWLAKKATDVAIGHAYSAAFYQDIVNRMKEKGAHVVSEIAEPEA